MRKLIIMLCTVFMVCIFLSIDTQAVTTNKWMEQIDNNKKISEISIPGTHDSGSLYEPVTGVAKCQDLNIWQQLNIGVRFWDIRCREYEDSLIIHHGSIYQHSNFDDVIKTCTAFLKNNPTETIIMSLKEEYNPDRNTKSFEEVFKSYVKKNESIWFLEDRIPKLGEVRGKIVLVRRFDSETTPMGIDTSGWKDNSAFTLNNAVRLSVQDCYRVGNNDSKWKEICKLYDRANISSNNELFINFTSGYKSILGVPDIRGVSGDINKRLLNYFNNARPNKYGITLVNFINEDISRSIISTNF